LTAHGNEQRQLLELIKEYDFSNDYLFLRAYLS